MDQAKFRDRLLRARKRSNMTQSHLAREADLVDGTVISRYERGEHKPSADSLGKLARALGVSIGWLAGEGDDALSGEAAA